jgi:hypothetical protein
MMFRRGGSVKRGWIFGPTEAELDGGVGQRRLGWRWAKRA